MDLMGNVSGSISLGGGGAGGLEDMLVKKTTEYESIVENNKAYLDLTWVASKADLADYVTLEDMTDYYDKIEVNGLLNDKQNKLTAGDNITINNNVISASGGGEVDILYNNVGESVEQTINCGDLSNYDLIIIQGKGTGDSAIITNSYGRIINNNIVGISFLSQWLWYTYNNNVLTFLTSNNNLYIELIKGYKF